MGRSKCLKQIIQIELNKVKNPNWPEENQLAIYKHGLMNPHNFLKINFHISLPKLGYFSKRKGNLKNVMESGIRKCLTFVIREIASKIFGKILILKPL